MRSEEVSDVTGPSATDLDIAVIGMACAFPGAGTPAEFWANLCDGVESVRLLSDEELLARGVPPETLRDPDYVKAAYTLDDVESFDAEFFGINPNEARATDPQHRLFLEVCWTALEDAGYDPATFDGDIGVFAGIGMNSYLLEVLARNAAFWQSTSLEQMMIGNDKDFLPSRVSYKLNLTGPSINVNTACSTSLVAIHLARQSLLLGESDMALVGGVSIIVPNGRGYRYMKDGIQSPDGHCRAFDAEARGTVWGDGAGVVVLKRLSSALADGDRILATVKGSAVNNDGAQKVGYTAPGVEGQSRVIVEALAEAGVSPDEVGYVEAHGTGTPLGDPVEITALTQAFRGGTDRTGYCAIGSVKTNIGHLNAAAGIAGFMKAVLAVQHGRIPASLNHATPNPRIAFAASPFRVQTELAEWSGNGRPRRAGISSMGIGGTNCHVIIEEAPATPRETETAAADHRKAVAGPAPHRVLPLSARTATALAAATDRLAEHLAAHPDLDLADVAYTLQCGRRHFPHRHAVVAASTAEAARILRGRDPGGLLAPGASTPADRPAADTHGAAELARWLDGENPDWAAIWGKGGRARVALPTYPFERQRYWYDATPDDGYFTKLPDMADWFSLPVWKPAPLPFDAVARADRRRLVLADDTGVGAAVADRLRARGERVVVVAAAGAGYERIDDATFTLDPADGEGYHDLFQALLETGEAPADILFCWPVDAAAAQRDGFARDAFEAAQDRALFPILWIAEALAEHAADQPVRLIAVTADVWDVTGGEPSAVDASTTAGACLVFQQSYGAVSARCVDLGLSGGEGIDAQAGRVLAELDGSASEMLCAYRGGRRYVRSYTPVRVEAAAPRAATLEKDRVYLVLGALEGIGHQIAEHIVRDVGGRLLILEEAGFPERAQWAQWLAEQGPDDPVSVRIRAAEALVAEGAAFVGALRTDHDANVRLLAEAEAATGPLAGVVHAPGASNAKRISTMRAVSIDDWWLHFDAVGHTLVLLDRMLGDRPLDFRIMTNSLGSVLGGDGFFHIATVGGFAKAYTAMRARRGGPTWSVQCWDSWTVEWSGISRFLPPSLFSRVEPSVLTSEEGVRCFERAFAVAGEVEVEISATDLARRYQKWVESTAARPTGPTERPAGHPRPQLETPFVTPRNPLEHDVADLFTQLLGVATVGADDSFFELGGHSLLGVELAAEVRRRYSIDMDLYLLYGMSTVADLAAHIDRVRA
jgi:acyl transferase domain-containing protein/acyl carrier protein